MTPRGSKNTSDTNLRGLSVAASKEAVELITLSRPQSQMSESYRALRTSLLLTSVGAPPKTLLITSALPHDGKTTTSTHTPTLLPQTPTRPLLTAPAPPPPPTHPT